MAGRRRLAGFGSLVAGALVGAAVIIASTEINRRTSTDAFCTSCHSMATMAADPHFTQSAHENNSAGVRVGCAECHIGPGSWFQETLTHATKGVKDVIAQYSQPYSDPAAWDARRKELAAAVGDEMRRSDSVTCRKCHQLSAIRPRSDGGRAAHATLQQGGATCVDCHANLVHSP